ncbi:hypothetical protein DIZ27_32590 [Streptomyces sp. NWU339]|nr:hypothetical protein DIZ27_32590 [Streptomyces sp. NWU339]
MSRKNCDSPEIRWIRDMTPSGLPVLCVGASAMWLIQSRQCSRVTSAKVVMPGWCSPSHCPKTRTASSSSSTVEGASVSLRAASHFSATASIRGGDARGGFRRHQLARLGGDLAAMKEHHPQLVQVRDPALRRPLAELLGRWVEGRELRGLGKSRIASRISATCSPPGRLVPWCQRRPVRRR